MIFQRAGWRYLLEQGEILRGYGGNTAQHFAAVEAAQVARVSLQGERIGMAQVARFKGLRNFSPHTFPRFADSHLLKAQKQQQRRFLLIAASEPTPREW